MKRTDKNNLNRLNVSYTKHDDTHYLEHSSEVPSSYTRYLTTGNWTLDDIIGCFIKDCLNNVNITMIRHKRAE